jgi:hypothetical protein
MRPNLSRKKTLIIIISFFVVIGALIFLLTIPFAKKVYQKKDLIEENRLILKKEKDNAEKYREDLEYLKNKISLIDDSVLVEGNSVELIENLEKIALDQSLELIIENYETRNTTKKTSESKNKVSLKLYLNGDYKNIMNFVYILQNFKYAINVEKIIIEKFDNSKIQKNSDLEKNDKLPEVESEIVISFN